MAAGFSESYIRLWNLKGGKLPGMRTDFDSDEIHDGTFYYSLYFFSPQQLPCARVPPTSGARRSTPTAVLLARC